MTRYIVHISLTMLQNILGGMSKLHIWIYKHMREELLSYHLLPQTLIETYILVFFVYTRNLNRQISTIVYVPFEEHDDNRTLANKRSTPLRTSPSTACNTTASIKQTYPVDVMRSYISFIYVCVNKERLEACVLSQWGAPEAELMFV